MRPTDVTARRGLMMMITSPHLSIILSRGLISISLFINFPPPLDLTSNHFQKNKRSLTVQQCIHNIPVCALWDHAGLQRAGGRASGQCNPLKLLLPTKRRQVTAPYCILKVEGICIIFLSLPLENLLVNVT